MSLTKHLTKAFGLAALTAVIVGLAGPAVASPVPPKAGAAMLGTWVNTNAASRSVKQVVITPNRSASVSVDAFGSCSPSLCEWGSVPAITYGANVGAATGTNFQTNQRFLSGKTEWSRTSLFGKVIRTRAGLRLTLRELTVFEDGSGRKNYQTVETFKRGRGLKPTKFGNPVSNYVPGTPPALAGAFGDWKNVGATSSLVSLSISGTTAAPLVRAFGQCSPTPCNWGVSKAIAYGTSISSAVGTTVLAPYTFGFKNAQLVISYSVAANGVEHLSVGEYSEFTDNSGRSNYTIRESFVRV